MKKQYTVAILGCGSRGAFSYGNLMMKKPERFKIVSLCDIKPSAIEIYKKEFGVKDEECFLDDQEFLKEKRADVLVIATQDKDHVRMAIRALELGYDILLEKPISPIKQELLDLLAAQKKYGGKVLVCHVLRYAPSYIKLKELLDQKAIGDLVRLEAIEQVAYWHEAHSFVRGNWRNEEETSPMILAKCCHDLDMIQYLVGSKCVSVFSSGDLAFFNKAHKPEGAADRCQNCKYIHTCPYSAETLYVYRCFQEENGKQGWPYNVVQSEKVPYGPEDLREAYENNQYGRCVFECDNNVVDNQVVDMTFENGVKASLVMTAFTALSGRKYTFHGTYGEIQYDESENFIKLYKYNGKGKPDVTVWNINELRGLADSQGFGHGGGDESLIDQFADILDGNIAPETTLEKSVESHLIGLAAEESRHGNKVVKVHE